jgi:hypothetical protein
MHRVRSDRGNRLVGLDLCVASQKPQWLALRLLLQSFEKQTDWSGRSAPLAMAVIAVAVAARKWLGLSIIKQVRAALCLFKKLIIRESFHIDQRRTR